MENQKALKIFDKVLADANLIKEEGNFLPDCSTKKGYEASREFVLKRTTKARTSLKDAHKEAKAHWIAGGKNVDAKKNELMDILLAAEEPHKLAYKAVDSEKKRLADEKEQAIVDRFEELVEILLNASDPDADSDKVGELLDYCQELDVDSKFFGVRIQSYMDKLQKLIDQLTTLVMQKAQFEQMKIQQAEMEVKQREMEAKQAEFDRIERERQAAEDLKVATAQAKAERIEREKQAAIQAEIDAENQRVYEAEQLKLSKQREIEREQARINHEAEMKQLAKVREQDRLNAIEAERIAKEQAETDRLYRVEQQRITDEKAELARIERENQAKASRTKNRNVAAKILMKNYNLDKDTAIKVCNGIAKNEVTFLSSNF